MPKKVELLEVAAVLTLTFVVNFSNLINVQEGHG